MCTRWLSQRTLFDSWTVHIVARQDRPCCQRQYEKVRHMETLMEEGPWRGALKRHAVLNGPALLHNVFAPGPQSGSSDISIDVQVLVLWTILGELGISGATLNDILDIPYIRKIFQSLLVTLVISYIFFKKKLGQSTGPTITAMPTGQRCFVLITCQTLETLKLRLTHCWQ